MRGGLGPCHQRPSVWPTIDEEGEGVEPAKRGIGKLAAWKRQEVRDGKNNEYGVFTLTLNRPSGVRIQV